MSRTKHYCQSNYKATEYCQSGHIELTWMSIQREKTKHQSLFKTVNKAGSSNGGGGHAGDSNGGEMVFGTHFPFFPFWGYVMQQVQKAHPTYSGIDGSLWFVVHWFLGFCHPGVFIQFQNLRSWISTCLRPYSIDFRLLFPYLGVKEFQYGIYRLLCCFLG